MLKEFLIPLYSAEIPLFIRGCNRELFLCAVRLLNRNIEQLGLRIEKGESLPFDAHADSSHEKVEAILAHPLKGEDPW